MILLQSLLVIVLEFDPWKCKTNWR